MKINRSTKCSLKFANPTKKVKLESILAEYGGVVNQFIDLFWDDCPKKAELLKPIIDSVDSWFSHRLRKVAAREAIDMVKSSKELEGSKPVHRCNRMCVSSTIADLQSAKETPEFDCWLHMASIGEKIKLDLPIKLHKHFNELDMRGKRLNAYIVTKDYIQFVFEVETGPKKEPNACIGIDTGINALASSSVEQQHGTDIKEGIERIKRCKHGSKGQKRAVRALKQRINEVAKEITDICDLVVVERLKNVTKGTKKSPKRRLGKNMRRSIGRWQVGYWLKRLEMTCQDKNVSFRTVSSWYTSQICHECGHTDRKNRSGQKFLCQICGHVDNADINAAKNILDRFLTGPYGAGCKPLTCLTT